jgi:hypothetical protein
MMKETFGNFMQENEQAPSANSSKDGLDKAFGERDISSFIKAIPVTGHKGPWGCETSRLPHFLENWLRDGSEVSLMRWPSFITRKT